MGEKHIPHFPSVTIRSDHPTRADISIDGKELDCVRSIVYEQDTESLASFTLETYGIPDIEIDEANVFLICRPQNVSEAARIIQHAIRTDKDMKNAWVASVKVFLSTKGLSDESIENLAEAFVEWIATA